MKIFSILTIVLISLTPFFSQGQQEQDKYFVEIHSNVGYSSDFSNSVTYRSRSFGEQIIISEKSHIFARSIGISLGKYFSKNFGFKISFGQLEYGFDFKGVSNLTNQPVIDAFTIRYLDFSAGFLFRTNITREIRFISSASYHFNSDASPNSPILNMNAGEASSLSVYAGLEFPMLGNHFFANAGFLFSHPLLSYNNNILAINEYLPYFIGLRIGFNFMF